MKTELEQPVEESEDPPESRPILICYDGRHDAERAVDVAAGLLAPRTAVVLGVAPPLARGQAFAASLSVIPTHQFGELNAADALERARKGAARAQEAGFSAQSRSVLAAPTWEGIVDIAAELDAAVIAMGSRASAGCAGCASSCAAVCRTRVAEHARRPVLIVPPSRGDAAHAPTGPILLCYDESRGARRAIRAAAALLRDREAVVLDAGPLLVDEGYPDVVEAAPSVARTGVRDGLIRAEAGVAAARQAGFKPVARVGSAGAPSTTVGAVADEIDARVIVMGSHGFTGMREALEGSVSHDVATHAHRPVLVVPLTEDPSAPARGGLVARLGAVSAASSASKTRLPRRRSTRSRRS